MLFGIAVISFKWNSVVLSSVRLCLREKVNCTAKLEPCCALSNSKIKIAWGPRWDLNHCCSAGEEIGFKFILRLVSFSPKTNSPKTAYKIVVFSCNYIIIIDILLKLVPKRFFCWMTWKIMTRMQALRHSLKQCNWVMKFVYEVSQTERHKRAIRTRWSAWKEWFVVMLSTSASRASAQQHELCWICIQQIHITPSFSQKSHTIFFSLL